MNQSRLTQVAFALGGFLRKYMTGERLASLDLAGSCLLKSLGC